MKSQSISINLKLELETAAEAVHYSKYHLHRLFNETMGMAIFGPLADRIPLEWIMTFFR